jgi:septum formation protein
MERLLLASASPRRRELLAAAGIPFDSVAPDIDETNRDSLIPSARVLALAEDKAKAASIYASRFSPRLVLGADTLVCLPKKSVVGAETALGKPRDAEDAKIMLHTLSGKVHVVRTGLVILDRSTGAVFPIRSDSTVRFAHLSEEEIESYLASGEWNGVAGAYRVQGLAAFFIDRIEGSWTGVVGLPMRELYVILQQAGYRVPFARMGD